jgi:hypothetical protein
MNLMYIEKCILIASWTCCSIRGGNLTLASKHTNASVRVDSIQLCCFSRGHWGK